MRLLAALCLLISISVHAEDPRLEKDDVHDCVENVKRFLRSSDYSGQKNEQAVIGACRDADPVCVAEAGESLHPSETMTGADFLKIVRACRGRGMGKCFSALKGTTKSADRREVSQILELLKKCE
ncbi:MAG: hypothetical protein ACXVA9_00685 [Bdellovibrionales bacterium]